MQLTDTTNGYASILSERGIPFTESGPYLLRGVPGKDQGWLLHISCVQLGFREVLRRVLPLLENSGLPYKLVRDQYVHDEVNGGKYGIYKYGKIFTVYLEEEDKALALLEGLEELTRGLIGPKIATDFRVGDILYLRYGIYHVHVQMDAYEMLHRQIMDSRGRWVRDVYGIPPVLPQGITNPFTKWIEQVKSKPIANPLKGKYELQTMLRSDIKGMEWEGLYTSAAGKLGRCLVTRVKIGSLSDKFGRDMIDRLRWSHKVWLKMQDDLMLPKEIDYWEEDDQAFWVRELDGKDFRTDVGKIFGRCAWITLPANDQKRLVSYLLNIGSLRWVDFAGQ